MGEWLIPSIVQQFDAGTRSAKSLQKSDSSQFFTMCTSSLGGLQPAATADRGLILVGVSSRHPHWAAFVFRPCVTNKSSQGTGVGKGLGFPWQGEGSGPRQGGGKEQALKL